MTGLVKRTGLSNLDKVKDLYNIKDSELSEALGYSKSAVTHWRKEGAMPAVAGLACECLLRRKGNGTDAAQSKLNAMYNLLHIAEESTTDLNTKIYLAAAKLLITG